MADEDGPSGEQLPRLYSERFTAEELAFKRGMWEILCESYFQQFIDPTETVVDLGATAASGGAIICLVAAECPYLLKG